MFAAFHKTPQTVRALLDAGAQVNARDEAGATALKAVVTAQPPDFFDRLFDRRSVREREQIIQMLRAAGGIK
jgi:ankyrin repeat protein